MATQFDIRIDTAGTLERLRAALGDMPKGIERARKRTNRKLATWVRRQVVRSVAQSVGVPQKTLLGLGRFSLMTSDQGMQVWIGTRPLKAHHLGTVRWTRRMLGARAGRRLFHGSWSWGKGSKTGPAIMERVESGPGGSRLPIQPVTVPIHETVLARVLGLEPEISERYTTLLSQELRYALTVEGRGR